MRNKITLKSIGTFSFHVYCTITLFIGTSVKSYYGLDSGEGLIGTINFLSIPFLLVSYFIYYKQCYINKNERIMFSLFFLAFFISRIIGGHSANIGLMVNIMLEPIFLISFMRGARNFNYSIVKLLIILFIITEAFVAIWEIINIEPLFMQETNILEGDFLRAYALHGHPLINAYLVCITCSALLFSDERTLIRYLVFFIGFIAILAFNTRSSMLIMGAILLYSIFIRLASKRTNFIWKIIFIIFIVLVCCKVADFTKRYDMGNRISISLGKDDGSANARYQLIDVILDSSPVELIAGRNKVSNIVDKYVGMAAIENSFLVLIFYWGILVVLPYFFYMYRDIRTLKVRKSLFRPWVIIMFLLLNVNNALESPAPVLPVSLLSLIAFSKSDNIEVVNIKMRHSLKIKHK